MSGTGIMPRGIGKAHAAANAMKLLRVAALAALLPLCAAAQNPAPAGTATAAPGQSAAGSRYTGSASCQSCHAQIYERWKKTPMANVVRDPREHPEAILPDLSKPDPIVKFGRNDIALVYGSIWKQRYFTKSGRRLLSGAGAVGHYQSCMAPLFRGQWNRLVGDPLSSRQPETADRADLRWVPFGELQHPG